MTVRLIPTLGSPFFVETVSASDTFVMFPGAVTYVLPASLITLSPVGIAPTGGIGTPSLSLSFTLEPVGIAPTGDIGTPSLSSVFVLLPESISSEGGVGVPSLSGSLSLEVVGIAPTGGVGIPVLIQGGPPAALEIVGDLEGENGSIHTVVVLVSQLQSLPHPHSSRIGRVPGQHTLMKVPPLDRHSRFPKVPAYRPAHIARV